MLPHRVRLVEKSNILSLLYFQNHKITGTQFEIRGQLTYFKFHCCRHDSVHGGFSKWIKETVLPAHEVWFDDVPAAMIMLKDAHV